MKGVAQSLWVVVTAVVVLIVALVILTMFGGGITNVATLAQAQSVCKNSFGSMCYKNAPEPSMYSQDTLIVNNVKQSCATACGPWESVCAERDGKITFECTVTG